jgi:dipeptidyl aminopeptidase/acylaminoacyl peptidase
MLHVPGRGRFPAVILCHGFTGSMAGEKYATLAEALCRAGFVALRFDFFYSGESGGWGNFGRMTLTGELIDLEAAVDFLSKRPEVYPARIGLFGHSLGGEIVLLHAAADRRVRCLVASAPAVDFKDVFERIVEKQDVWKARGRAPAKGSEIAAVMEYSFFEDGLKYSPLERAKAIRCPLLIIHGEADTCVPLASSQLLYKEANEPKKMVTIKGSEHDYEGPGQLDEMVSAAIGWFKQYL